MSIGRVLCYYCICQQCLLHRIRVLPLQLVWALGPLHLLSTKVIALVVDPSPCISGYRTLYYHHQFVVLRPRLCWIGLEFEQQIPELLQWLFELVLEFELLPGELFQSFVFSICFWSCATQEHATYGTSTHASFCMTYNIINQHVYCNVMGEQCIIFGFFQQIANMHVA